MYFPELTGLADDVCIHKGIPNSFKMLFELLLVCYKFWFNLFGWFFLCVCLCLCVVLGGFFFFVCLIFSRGPFLLLIHCLCLRFTTKMGQNLASLPVLE